MIRVCDNHKKLGRVFTPFMTYEELLKRADPINPKETLLTSTVKCDIHNCTKQAIGTIS